MNKRFHGCVLGKDGEGGSVGETTVDPEGMIEDPLKFFFLTIWAFHGN